MRGALEDNQLFWLRRFVILRANSWEPQPARTRVVARHNKQGRCFEFLGGAVRCGAKEYEPMNLARLDRKSVV